MNNILVIIGMLAGLCGAIWQGGRVEASLEAGVHSETEARQTDIRTLKELIIAQSADIRDIRMFMLTGKRPNHE